MWWNKIFTAIAILTFLLHAACSEESNQIATPLNNDNLIGTWLLTEIKYPSNGNIIIVLPGDIGLSMTLKFFETKTGQMTKFEKGVTRIDIFMWNVLGPVVELVNGDGDWETLRCEFIESDLCIENRFETNEGNFVLASYVFEKEKDQ